MIIDKENAIKIAKICLITSTIIANLEADIDEFFEGNEKSKEEYFDALYQTIGLFNLGEISASIDGITARNNAISPNIIDLINKIANKSVLRIEKDEIISRKLYNSYKGYNKKYG